MNRFRNSAILIAALVAGSGSAVPETTPAAEGRPVVVELFTSQGCSSCPPADRLLSRLMTEMPGRVIPLAFHVDYWNRGGWTDPFSSHRWSERQGAYARKFHLEAPYTPQAVIDGAVEMVGSREDRVRAAIASDAAKPSAAVTMHLAPEAARVRVDVDVDRPDALRQKKLDLMIAIYETGLSTAVERGENGGRTLHDDVVVRALTRATRISAGGPAQARGTAEMALEKGWNRGGLGVAAFLQDPWSLEIFGAAAMALPAGGGE
jgi:hypothetical protein